MLENNNLVINSAKSFATVVNIGSSDLIEGREHLILGLIWQIIRRGLLSKIDIKLHPELYRLLEEDETLEQFLRLPPEQILLRWFNYHLKAANWHRRFPPKSQSLIRIEWQTLAKTSKMAKITPSSSTSSTRQNVRVDPSKPATSSNVLNKSSKMPTN
jgi:hypothetical protein